MIFATKALRLKGTRSVEIYFGDTLCLRVFVVKF